MRDSILFYLNGERLQVKGAEAFLTLADYLREKRLLTGTKVVCSEGDCGACTILRAALPLAQDFLPVNSCILPLFLLDGSVLVTIEGLKKIQGEGELHPVQEAMVACHGSQCGFCTPGMVMGLCGLFEQKKKVNAKNVQNALTGNLCRCTGYLPIIQSALLAQKTMKEEHSLKRAFLTPEVLADLRAQWKIPVHLEHQGRSFSAPLTMAEASVIKKELKNVRVFSSATDLGVLINKNKVASSDSMSLHLIDELYEMKVEDHELHVGAKVTLAQLQEFVRKLIPEFYEFLHLFASPQIKNVATLVGNLANASPIADTIPFLMASNARKLIVGPLGERTLLVSDFFLGYKKIALTEGELIQKLIIPLPSARATLKLYKISNRRDLDISTVNAAFYLEEKNGKVSDLRLAYGGVGPTVLRLHQVEKNWQGREWNEENMRKLQQEISHSIAPLSDMRASSEYRHLVARNLLEKFYVESRER